EDGFSAWRNGKGADGGLAPLRPPNGETVALLAGRRDPHPHRAVTGGGSQELAVGRQGEVADSSGVSLEQKQLLVCLHVPHLESAGGGWPVAALGAGRPHEGGIGVVLVAEPLLPGEQTPVRGKDGRTAEGRGCLLQRPAGRGGPPGKRSVL